LDECQENEKELGNIYKNLEKQSWKYKLFEIYQKQKKTSDSNITKSKNAEAKIISKKT